MTGRYTLTYNNENLLTEYLYDNFQFGNIIETEKDVFFYSPENTNAITDLENTKINIYPNPATTILNIDSEEELDYKIYSIQGKLIKNGTTFKEVKINELEKGIYFIHLKTNTFRVTNKFIVE